ncbi:hypothetical protein B0J13DRAFT_258131 [Dactylonectria estremocensis]|uniref:Uncharacterized protein n=1 Tax=Dactylonectria estremocensis TaxID=1079267 RepID=A0A9P9F4M9_9HYPO|nr:hypothetical protein B0J13DRAFT_258131 [Dactylonectria estremocensis]
MADTSSNSLQQLPLHLVARILAELETIQQLGSAILSHRIFLLAFNDNLHSVTSDIIASQIPSDVLPFALALEESTRVNKKSADAISSVLVRLESRIRIPADTFPCLLRLSASQAASISKSYTLVEILSDGLVEEAIPVLNERLLLSHPLHTSPSERFRLSRAFFRYQLMCELLCYPMSARGATKGHFSLFFQNFSPWVNDQLVCAYTYLERKVYGVFGDVAAHDIVLGEMPVYWQEDPAGDAYVQEFLLQGLPYLVSICHAKTYDERSNLITLSRFKAINWDCHPSQRLNEMIPDLIRPSSMLGYEDLVEVRTEMLPMLAQPLDGEQDALVSKACLIWHVTHLESPLADPTWRREEDRNLLQMGYVLWDYPDDASESDRQSIWEAVRDGPNVWPSRDIWTDREVTRSLRQREDIWLAGGTGYWPRDSFDFSKIDGVAKERQKSLIEKWKREDEKWANSSSLDEADEADDEDSTTN